MDKVGLILEGGGMRGIYTAGVLDFFIDKNIEVDLVVGVSAGGCHAASYLSKQYNNFTMLNGNNEGNVKFIMIIDAIKKQEDTTKEQAILNNSEDNKNEKEENY